MIGRKRSRFGAMAHTRHEAAVYGAPAFGLAIGARGRCSNCVHLFILFSLGLQGSGRWAEYGHCERLSVDLVCG